MSLRRTADVPFSFPRGQLAPSAPAAWRLAAGTPAVAVATSWRTPASAAWHGDRQPDGIIVARVPARLKASSAGRALRQRDSLCGEVLTGRRSVDSVIDF